MLKDPLFLTIVIECAVLLLLREKELLFYLYWIAITSLTNIPANLYVALVFSGTRSQYFITVAVIEILVIAIECIFAYLYTNDLKKSLKYSAVCNTASYLIGAAILLLL